MADYRARPQFFREMGAVQTVIRLTTWRFPLDRSSTNAAAGIILVSFQPDATVLGGRRLAQHSPTVRYEPLNVVCIILLTRIDEDRGASGEAANLTLLPGLTKGNPGLPAGAPLYAAVSAVSEDIALGVIEHGFLCNGSRRSLRHASVLMPCSGSILNERAALILNCSWISGGSYDYATEKRRDSQTDRKISKHCHLLFETIVFPVIGF
jgi:hypothetical protein